MHTVDPVDFTATFFSLYSQSLIDREIIRCNGNIEMTSLTPLGYSKNKNVKIGL